MRQPVARAKANDAGVLKETANYTFHPDVFGKARHTGAQTTNAAHDKIDLNSGLACLIEGVDDSGVNQRIELAPDVGGPTRLGMGNFIVNMLEETRLQIDWRKRELFQVFRLGIPGYEIEQPR